MGISSAVGAFLVGLAIPNTAARRARRVLNHCVTSSQRSSLLRIEDRLGGIPGVLPEALLLGLVTAITKILTGWYAAGRQHAAPRGRMRAGTALVARGGVPAS